MTSEILMFKNAFLAPGVVVEDTAQLLLRLVVATAIGLLLGFEREYSHKDSYELFAGSRTFPLITMLGFVSMLLANHFSPMIFIVALAGVMALVIASHILTAKEGDYGGTTDVTVIITFLLGALVFQGFLHMAVACAVFILLLLSLKKRIQAFRGKLQYEDIASLIKFCIISVIILPLLPNNTFGPYNVLNPRTIWFFVVLIASINFIAYLLTRIIGGNRGILWTGVAGGLLSSTAVAWSFANKSNEDEQALAPYYSVAIVLASSIMFARVLAITYVFNRLLAASLLTPLLLMMFAGLVSSYLLLKSQRSLSARQRVEFKNPLNLSGAIKFGMVFALIIVLVSVAKEYLGDRGVYLVSALSGLHDVDAITVSVSRLATSSLMQDVAKNAILIGALANTLIKCGIALFFGRKELKKHTLIGFSGIFAAAAIYIVLVNLV